MKDWLKKIRKNLKTLGYSEYSLSSQTFAYCRCGVRAWHEIEFEDNTIVTLCDGHYIIPLRRSQCPINRLPKR